MEILNNSIKNDLYSISNVTEDINKKIDNLYYEKTEIYKTIGELNNEKEHIYKEIKELKDEKNSIILNIEKINEEKNNLNEKISYLDNKIQQIEKALDENKNEIFTSMNSLQKENAALKTKIESIESEKNNKNKYYYNLFQGTKILKNDEKKAIAKWIKPYHNLKFRLLYQATRDGYTSDNFHSKCDNKGPTVFIIVSTNGRRFGGFTSSPWNKENKEYYDDNAFLFSLDSRTKFGVKNKGKATTYAHGGSSVCFGPGYGTGDDFIVKNAKVNVHYKGKGQTFNFSKDEIFGKEVIFLNEFEVYAVENYIP